MRDEEAKEYEDERNKRRSSNKKQRQRKSVQWCARFSFYSSFVSPEDSISIPYVCLKDK